MSKIHATTNNNTNTNNANNNSNSNSNKHNNNTLETCYNTLHYNTNSDMTVLETNKLKTQNNVRVVV